MSSHVLDESKITRDGVIYVCACVYLYAFAFVMRGLSLWSLMVPLVDA